jgi:DNA-binding transcriptional regulator GbsR (MarR family)
METANNSVENARQCLIKAAGWTTQDFGMGRIVGEVFALTYLTETHISLDDIAEKLKLSKAAVSIATRQLDKLSLLVRVKNPGDRKTYYRTSEHFAASLQYGILEMLRAKLKSTEDVLNQAESFLVSAEKGSDVDFLQEQIDRARRVRNSTDKIINNPLLKLISKP